MERNQGDGDYDSRHHVVNVVEARMGQRQKDA